jgi:hypothetical protein
MYASFGAVQQTPVRRWPGGSLPSTGLMLNSSVRAWHASPHLPATGCSTLMSSSAGGAWRAVPGPGCRPSSMLTRLLTATMLRALWCLPTVGTATRCSVRCPANPRPSQRGTRPWRRGWRWGRCNSVSQKRRYLRFRPLIAARSGFPHADAVSAIERVSRTVRVHEF